MAQTQYWTYVMGELHEGLNISMDTDLCFTDTKTLVQNVQYWRGAKIARVTIPEGARVVREGTMSRTDRFILTDIVFISNWCMWENPHFCLDAVKENPYALVYMEPLRVKDPDSYMKVCLDAVKKDWYILFVMEHSLRLSGQYEEIYLRTLSNQGFTIRTFRAFIGYARHVNTCLDAVRKNGLLLELVNSQSLTEADYAKICAEAVKQNEKAIEFVKTTPLTADTV